MKLHRLSDTENTQLPNKTMKIKANRKKQNKIKIQIVNQKEIRHNKC